MCHIRSHSAGIVAAVLLGAAGAVLVLEPWHGPVVLSLSGGHGIHVGDLPALPLVAVAVAIGRVRERGAPARPRWAAGRWTGPASAIVLGALLLACGIDSASGRLLLPGGFGTPDDARAALLFIAAVWFCVVLASGGDARVARPGISYWPLIGLFLAGSVVDVALAPSDTLIGPILVTVWYAVTASNPDEATSLYLIAAGFAALTVASVARPGGLELAPGEGGIARSTAFGLLLVTVGLLTAHRTSGKPRASAPAA